jgi:putative PIN family toxin of toxin-antitoxin system
MRVLLDTNVLASAIVGLQQGSTASPAMIFLRWERGDFDLVLSEHILAEFARTLEAPFFTDRVPVSFRREALSRMRTLADIVEIVTQVTGVATHPEDDMVLSTAISGHVQYLVTGDAQLQKIGQYQGISILAPRAFLELLDQLNQLPRSSG